ncbi:MAG: hypothetical protein HQL08_16165 [Nitrospirae bacterium]|nr:hypothetical protein [Nitrospirota bacterium]
MKILHILNDGHNTLAEQIARIQAENNEVSTIDLTASNLSYEKVIDAIFSNDRVISWHGEEESN